MVVDPLPITFALVEPSEPGNVGAVARSLAAFGFGELILIEPRRKVSPKDRTLAVRIGREVLHQTRVWSDAEFLARAPAYDEIWGTSARDGRRRRPESARQLVADYLSQEAKRILLLFGPERDGLSLTWLDRCHRLLRLPTRDGCPLNLAQAVTVCAYEFRSQIAEAGPGSQPEGANPATSAGSPISTTSRLPGDALAVSLRDRQELLHRTTALLAELDYPSRALHGHPPSAYLHPLRAGTYSQGQARWLLGLLTRIERRLGMRPHPDDPCKSGGASPPPDAAPHGADETLHGDVAPDAEGVSARACDNEERAVNPNPGVEDG